MKKVYNNLPHWIKSIVVNFYGYFLERKRYSKKFHKILQYYLDVDKTESIKPDMGKIIELAKNSSFYSIKNESDFYESPIINKEIIKSNYDSIFNKEYNNSFLNTGGTTGSGLKYPVSKEFIYHQWAIFWKFRIIHGLNLKSWCAYLIGKSMLRKDKKQPPFWIKSYSTRQLLLSLPHLNKNTVILYLQQIKSNDIKWIHAYPSALNLLASLIQDMNLHKLVKSLDLSLITTSSEILYEYQKSNIEKIFGCKVRQLYGLTEGVANIFECEESNLHVDESFSYVEFIKEDEDKEYYKIIGTQYYNKAFPLIRYDTGDHVLLYENNYKCNCGRNSRVVKEIIGREQDYLLLNDNTKRVRIGSILFRESYNIKKAQIIQRQKGEADFLIVKGPEYSLKDEKLLINQIREFLGNNFKYRIIYTETLHVSKNGKIQLIINEINDDRNDKHSIAETEEIH
jgi:phenylacetate-CoA ligase